MSEKLQHIESTENNNEKLENLTRNEVVLKQLTKWFDPFHKSYLKFTWSYEAWLKNAERYGKENVKYAWRTSVEFLWNKSKIDDIIMEVSKSILDMEKNENKKFWLNNLELIWLKLAIKIQEDYKNDRDWDVEFNFSEVFDDVITDSELKNSLDELKGQLSKWLERREVIKDLSNEKIELMESYPERPKNKVMVNSLDDLISNYNITDEQLEEIVKYVKNWWFEVSNGQVAVMIWGILFTIAATIFTWMWV